jgi:hypothetical protein
MGWLNANAHARVFAILQQEHDMTPATLHAVDFPQPTTVGYAHDVSSVNPNQKADNVRQNNEPPQLLASTTPTGITSVAYRSPASSALSLTPRTS